MLQNRNIRSIKSIVRLFSCSAPEGATQPLFLIKGNFTASNHTVDSYVEIEHIFDQPSVDAFAKLAGDNNPIHNDPVAAQNTMFKGTICHGILVSSLFSTLLGRSCHGSVYVSQTLQFRRPVHVGAKILARVDVIKVDKKSKGSFVTCKTVVTLPEQRGILAVDGEAVVLIPN